MVFLIAISIKGTTVAIESAQVNASLNIPLWATIIAIIAISYVIKAGLRSLKRRR